MTRFLFILLILIPGFAFYSSAAKYQQQSEIDSLLAVLREVGEDTNKVKALNSLSWRKLFNYPDTAKILSNQALNLGLDLNYKIGIAKTYTHLGINHAMKGNYDSAVFFTSQSLRVNQELNDSSGIGDSYSNMGVIYKRMGDYKKSMESHLNALKIWNALNDQSGQMSSYNNMGVLSDLMGNSENSLEYYEQSLKMARTCNSEKDISIALSNIGILHFKEGRYELALEYYVEDMEISLRLGRKSNIATSYLNIGGVYHELGEYKKALDYYAKSLEINEEIGSRSYIADCYLNIGKLYISTGDYQLAISHLQKALTISREVEAKEIIKDVLEWLAVAYSEINQYKQAYAYHREFTAMKDSLLNEEKAQQINELEIKYESEKKHNEIILLSKETELQNVKIIAQTRIRNILIGTFILVLILSTFLFRDYQIRLRAKQEKLKASLQLEHLELEKMKEADDVKSRFVANISHEFRTPLTLILGPLKDYVTGQNIPSSDLKLFSLMYRNGQKLLQLINQLLDISKLESGKTKLRVSANGIVKFAKLVFANFTSLAEHRNITYTISHEPEEIQTYFDMEALEKVLNNLLTNAMKFTGSGGRMDLIIEQNQKYAVVKVRDTGIGIPTKHIGNIFERFYQIDDSRTKKNQGVGIGLALAKELVELHHGEIKVKSKEDAGSTFTVKLLLGHAHFSSDELIDSTVRMPETEFNHYPIPDKSPETIYEIDENSPLVMIVEDNSDMRYYIRKILEKEYKVIEAENGAEGFYLAIKSIPDIIITDVMMPEMDGFEFCKKLKTDERTSHVPVIMLTAKVTDEHKLEGLQMGADAYLTKPFNVEELVVIVDKLIEQRHKLREKFSRIIGVVPSDVIVESADEKFLRNALQTIEDNISNTDFDVDGFAKEMGFSRVQLYRKIKALTNFSIGELIRNIRIQRAAQLMLKKDGNITDIAYRVGFNNMSYFSKCFKEQFGISPSHYQSR